MTAKQINAGILGTGYYLPEKILSNSDLEKIVDTSDEWITERTGIKERRIAADDVATSDLALRAAEMALKDAKVSPDELDLIIVATLTSDRIIPSTACIIQDLLGAKRAAAFDLSAACSGFAYGITVASQFIQCGAYRKALVIGAETLSKYINWEDRNTCVLFGDGAGAAVLGQVEDGYGILSFDLGSDGSGGDAIQIPSSGSRMPVSNESIEKRLNLIHMNGKEVFKFAVKAMGNTVKHSLEKIGMKQEEINWLVPHQANIRIIQSAAKRLAMPMEKVIVNIQKYVSSDGLRRINMFEENPICKLLGIKYPIFQGGMAWIGTAELASAVSNAGGLGIIGAGHMPPDILRAEIQKAKKWTDKPFGVNIMLMSPFVKEVMQVVVDERVAVVTTGAGNPAEYLPALKEVGTKVIPVVASVALAKRLVRSGVDAVIAEGTESGGHIGDITTMALVPQVVDAVNVPVIAAGGIGDSRGIAAAISLGASGVQMGSRFVVSEECIAHENYKNLVLKAKDRSTVVTGRSTGHPVRVLSNKMTREYAEMEARQASVEELEKFGAGRLNLATHKGDVENGSVMIGQISGMFNEIKPVAVIIDELVSGLSDVQKRLNDFLK